MDVIHINKVKIITKLGTTKLVIKGQKGQHISEREAYAINTEEVSGLLKVKIEQEQSSFILSYDISGLVSLKDFVGISLNRRTFTVILASIVNTLKMLEENYFSKSYLLLNIDKVMIKPTTYDVFFIAVPIQGFESEGSLKELLLDIKRYAKFERKESTGYIEEYIQVLNRGINFSMFDLEEYIKELIKSGEIISTVSNSVKVNIQDEKKDNKTYNPLGILAGSRAMSDAESVYRLHRTKTGEMLVVNNHRYSIGKSEQCNYCICDNRAISRIHASLILKGSECYICDEGSMNGTFINGTRILVGQEKELYDGNIIQLADEEFILERVRIGGQECQMK
ncbi:MAG: FHA domain-containing protein [Lachnospiraceae bacterium]|nr:FHA domain-containing protein [Lachnospiraceae bacterium]